MERLIHFGGLKIKPTQDSKGRMLLNDLYKIAGSPKNKDPRQWLRLDTTEILVDSLAEVLGVEKSHLLNVQIGKGKVQGSFIHKNLWLSYAKYLDAKLHLAVNQLFFERIEEEKNPDLIADRYVRTWKKKGKSEDWIKNRFQGITTRNELTSTLKKHGVEHEGYRNVTNAIYNPLYGGTSNVVREKKGLSKKDNIRDNLPKAELRAVELAELLAKENIERYNLKGNAQCELAAARAGKSVAEAIKKSRESVF